MLTKAIIKELPKNGSNIFTVMIPAFKNSSITNGDSKLDASICNATLCYVPGMYYGYKTGDVVYVGFEDNKYNKAVILGKLYINSDAPDDGKLTGSSLQITNSVDLPSNINIDGSNILSWIQDIVKSK